MDRKYSTRVISAVRYCLALAGIAVIGVVPAARARVTTLIINDTQPAFGGASFGSVGTYEVITGTFTDEVAPNDPHDAVITDIGLGPKTPRNGQLHGGFPNYQADQPGEFGPPGDLRSAEPRQPGAGGCMLLGSPPVNTAVPPGSGGAGNGFLMNLGWTIVEVGWDLTVPQGGALFGITLPAAKKSRWIIDHRPRSRDSSSIKARPRRTCRSPIRQRASTSPKPC